ITIKRVQQLLDRFHRAAAVRLEGEAQIEGGALRNQGSDLGDGGTFVRITSRVGQLQALGECLPPPGELFDSGAKLSCTFDDVTDPGKGPLRVLYALECGEVLGGESAELLPQPFCDVLELNHRIARRSSPATDVVPWPVKLQPV